MSEYKGSSATDETDQDFAAIVKQERKRLSILNKQIDRVFWQLEKEEQLEESKNQQQITELSKRLRGFLDAYDRIVKRLTDLKQKAPESEESDDSGYRKEITSLINWAKEGSDKHQLILFKVDNSIDNKTQQQEKRLLRDLPGTGCRSTKRSKARRQHNNHLVRR